jgi:hypothetical protein
MKLKQHKKISRTIQGQKMARQWYLRALRVYRKSLSPTRGAQTHVLPSTVLDKVEKKQNTSRPARQRRVGV